jgi:ribose-phosphate pyrophosphokinase
MADLATDKTQRNRKIVLATNSAKHFYLDNGVLDIKQFPDGEICIALDENVTNKEVVVIGSTQPPAENLLELILLIGAVSQRGAKRITVVIPYFGYDRADKENNKSETVSAKTIVKMLEEVSERKCRFFVLDPHGDNLKNYFDSPFNKIDITCQLAERFSENRNLTVVAPDRGAKERAIKFARRVNSKNIVMIEKKRLLNSKVKILSISGKITPTAVIVDDMVSSGNTILETAKMLKVKGAKKIHVAVTHMVYSAGGWKRLAKSALIDKVYMTDSILPPRQLPNKFKLINLATVLKHSISL